MLLHYFDFSCKKVHNIHLKFRKTDFHKNSITPINPQLTPWDPILTPGG